MSWFSEVVLCCVTDFRGFSLSAHSHTSSAMATHFGKKPSKLSPLCLISAQLYFKSFVGFFQTCALHNMLSHLRFIFRLRFWFRWGRDQSHENLCDWQYLTTALSITISEVSWWVWKGKFWELSFNHLSLIFFSFTCHRLNIPSHLPPSSAFLRAVDGISRRNKERQKERGSGWEPGCRHFGGSLLDSLGALVSLWKWSCSWGLTCTGTSLTAQGLWFGESQDVCNSGSNREQAQTSTLKFVCPVVTQMRKLVSPPILVLLNIHNLLLPPFVSQIELWSPIKLHSKPTSFGAVWFFICVCQCMCVFFSHSSWSDEGDMLFSQQTLIYLSFIRAPPQSAPCWPKKSHHRLQESSHPQCGRQKVWTRHPGVRQTLRRSALTLWRIILWRKSPKTPAGHELRDPYPETSPSSAVPNLPRYKLVESVRVCNM